jgi:AraC-like DNA-binding protein
MPKEAVDRAEAENSEGRISVALSQQLLQTCVQLTGDENLGLLAARETELGGFDVLEYVAFSAPTWRVALETVFRYTRVLNEAADFKLEVVGDKAHIMLLSTVALSRAGTDFQSAAFHVTTSRWLDRWAPELEAWFTHAAPKDLSVYEATFRGARLVFGAPWSGFVYDAARLGTPLASGDPALHQVLRRHAEHLLSLLAPGDGLVDRVRAHILATMGGQQARAEDTAAHLGLSRRTLTRRLQHEGTSFLALLDDVRHQSATHYLLTTDHSVEDIAFLLGFSESPPFVRAFKRWTGMAPSAYRRMRRRAV